MIFRIGKTVLRLSFSFVALITLMLLMFDEKIVLFTLSSSLIHETGHLLFMYIYGEIPVRIDFSLFGVKIERSTCVHISYKKELIIALGGIIFNLMTALIGFVLFLFLNSVYCLTFSAVNLAVAAVNMFPVSILDFGKGLRFALLIKYDKDKSDLYADYISCVFVLLFVFFSVLYYIYFGANISLAAVNLYLIFITIIKKRS